MVSLSRLNGGAFVDFSVFWAENTEKSTKVP